MYQTYLNQVFKHNMFLFYKYFIIYIFNKFYIYSVYVYYFINNYLDYLYEKHFKQLYLDNNNSIMIKITFINWWSNGIDDFFHLFVKKFIDDNVIFCNNNPDIVFCSVFGNRNNIINYLNSHKNCISVFFTGESTKHKFHTSYDDYLLDIVDISLGFKNINHNKYIRFPLWITYFNIDDINCSIKDMNINNLNTFRNIEIKTKFCCILNNHDMYNTRTDIFNALSKYSKVDSGGSWNKNISYNITSGEKNKQEWLSKYKFNICCESLIDDGYITEKLFECLLAGCIPIYIVNNENDDIEQNILNQEVILKFTRDNIEKLVEKVIELNTDNDKYTKFINQKIIKENAKNEILNKYELLTKLLKNKLFIH